MNIEKKESNGLRTLLVIIGAVVSLAAIFAALYMFFKKYFKISFECDDDLDECDCNGCFVEEDDKRYEPICDLTDDDPEESEA